MPNIELLSVQDASTQPQVLRLGQMAGQQPASNITVTASPFTFQNVSGVHANVVISGGTVTTISWSRDNSTYFLIGLLAGQFHLSPNDFLRVVYVSAPTMTLCPF